MGPTIGFYQGIQWDENEKYGSFSKILILKKITLHRSSGLLYCYQTFLKALEQSPEANVCFGYEHDEILFQLHEHENMHIINIDHHDDVMASDFESIQII